MTQLMGERRHVPQVASHRVLAGVLHCLGAELHAIDDLAHPEAAASSAHILQSLADPFLGDAILDDENARA